MAPITLTIPTGNVDNGFRDGGDEIGKTKPAGIDALAARAHVSLLYLAILLPAPTGNVSKVMQTVPLGYQRTQAEEFFRFLKIPNLALPCLNKGNKRCVALVSVPKNSLVKVVYGSGFGSSPIGATASPVDEKFLLLQGEGNLDIGPPQQICLQATMGDTQEVATMTENQFSSTLTAKGQGYTYPLLPQIVITTTEEMLKLAPSHPYFMYDGLDQDLDATCVLKRILLVNPEETSSIKHLKKFLLACLSLYNTGDNKPYVASTDFSAT